MKIRIDSTTYEIPASYTQVKFIDFANAKTTGLPLDKKISYQTGIPVEIITNLPYGDLVRLLPALSFWDDEPEFFEPFTSEDVGNEHYVKLEQSRAILSKSDNKWLAVIEVVKIYTGKDISGLKVTEAMGYAAFFLSKLESSSKDTSGSESTSLTKTN